jgi:hypothetical protein
MPKQNRIEKTAIEEEQTMQCLNKTEYKDKQIKTY